MVIKVLTCISMLWISVLGQQRQVTLTVNPYISVGADIVLDVQFSTDQSDDIMLALNMDFTDGTDKVSGGCSYDGDTESVRAFFTTELCAPFFEGGQRTGNRQFRFTLPFAAIPNINGRSATAVAVVSGLITVTSVATTMTLLVPPSDLIITGRAPVEIGSNKYLNDTASVLLTCSLDVSTRPSPQLVWVKDGNEIIDPSPVEVVTANGDGDLYSQTISYTLSGGDLQGNRATYVICKSKFFTAHSKTVTFYRLTVPSLTTEPGTPTVYVEPTVSQTLKCTSSGASPKADLSWKRVQGSPIVAPAQVETVDAQGLTVSTLSYTFLPETYVTTSSPQALFQCVALSPFTNIISDIVTIELGYVSNPDDAKVTIEETSGALKCPFDGYPTPTYSWYTVGDNEQDLSQVSGANAREYAASLGGTYYFACRAENNRASRTAYISSAKSGSSVDNPDNGVTIGVAVGVTVVVLLIITIIGFVCWHRNKKGSDKSKSAKKGTPTPASRSVVYTQENNSQNSDQVNQPERPPRQNDMIYADLDLSKQAAGLVAGKRTPLSMGETMYAEIDLLRTQQKGGGDPYDQQQHPGGPGGPPDYYNQGHHPSAPNPEFDDGLPPYQH